MFSYDATLLSAVQTRPQAVADVVRVMETSEETCIDGDGLRWFNWLYLRVTRAVETCVVSGTFADAAWISELDVQFACFYFAALESALEGRAVPGCWETLFGSRNNTAAARIQFALAGINAHINHDLPQAIVACCKSTATIPEHASAHYTDYTALNATLDSLIETAKQTLYVRLLGAPLPAVSHLEDTIAAWSVSAAREAAWQNGELLWHLRDRPPLSSNLIATLDGLTTVVGKALLTPVPLL